MTVGRLAQPKESKVPPDSEIRDPPLPSETNVISLISLVSFLFCFLEITTDASGLTEGLLFLLTIGFGFLSPTPCKLYLEINLMILFSTGMSIIDVSGVLSSLGFMISKDEIAVLWGHCRPQGRCAVGAVAACPRLLRRCPVFSILFHEPTHPLTFLVPVLSRIMGNLLHKM